MLVIFLVALVAIFIGTAFCFMGYRVFLFLLPFWGFVAGFWLGAEASMLIFGRGFLATSTDFIMAFVVGLIIALLSYMFYILGVAIIAASFGAAVGTGFMAWFGFEGGMVVAVVAIVCGLIVAGITLLLDLQKFVIITITAIGGANVMLLGALILFDRVSLESVQGAGNGIEPMLQDSSFWLIAWLVLTLVGIFTQVKANRTYTFTRNRHHEERG